MTAPAWHDLAARIPLWPGAVMDFGRSRWQVQAIAPSINHAGPGALWIRVARLHIDGEARTYEVDPAGWWHALRPNLVGHMGEPFRPTLDLRDPDTFRGAVARLALAMGTPKQAVLEGCVFHQPPTGQDLPTWVLTAGPPRWMPNAVIHTFHRVFQLDTRDPAEALAVAWAQHLDRSVT